MTPTSPDDLEARIRTLEAENARLAGRATSSGGWWRAALSALLIVIATILVPVSVVTTWARVQLVDEAAFVATFAPLTEDPAVQELIVDEATAAIDEQVDFTALTNQVFDGVESLGLPPAAATALNALRAPAAQGVQNLVNSAVERIVASEAFSDVWGFALRGVHRSITTAATADGGGILVLDSDGLGIALGPIIEQVKERLTESGVGVASLIPTIDKTIIIGDGEALTTFRTVYALADAVGWWLSVVTIGLFVLAIVIARRRSVAVIGTGVGLFIGGGMLAAGFGIGAAASTVLAGQLDLSPSALSVIYAQLTASMAQSALVIAVLGVVIAVIGWLMGSSRGATAVRGGVSGLNATAREALAARGLNTGGFGRFLARYRVAIRVALVVLAVVWLLALRPLSFADVVVVFLVTIIVAWVLELLQQREIAEVEVVEVIVSEEETASDRA
ncbi:hypothetical protein IT882_05055 [Microbacterium schleiferi]|uniref:Integral membrane protein n=1 Tax=Microbacterium schleiferi TaxID=69362 RepID=A0A7S8RIH9_9MICO|nr:hypothetical protein [Microbacterium schleiferi]QPE05417.1 hypothetical protein IT882_05055 [Microbacterium schleiferi]